MVKRNFYIFTRANTLLFIALQKCNFNNQNYYDKSRSEFNELKLINGSPRIKFPVELAALLFPFNSWLSLKLD